VCLLADIVSNFNMPTEAISAQGINQIEDAA